MILHLYIGHPITTGFIDPLAQSGTAKYSFTKPKLDKVVKASEAYEIKTIAIAGGVSVNNALRSIHKEKANEHDWDIHIPKLAYLFYRHLPP